MTDSTRQPALARLIARLSSLIAASTEALEADLSRVDDWYDELARQLRRYTLAAYLSGNGQQAPTAQGEKLIAAQIKSQIEYLAAFRDEVKASDEWKPGWNSRAAMYAGSIKLPYWAGKTRGLPLPSMPTEGVQCLSNCGCAWEIDWIDEENGDADAYWRRNKSDSCQSCVERERQWSPVQIRNGVLL